MLYYYPDLRVRKDTSPEGRFNWYEVVEETAVYGAIDNMIVPVGFITDFASIPRILWTIIPPHGLAMPASILHDYMYTTQHFQDLLGAKAARFYADDLFYRNLLDFKMNKWQAKAMFLAVRWFGKGHWKRKGNRKK